MDGIFRLHHVGILVEDVERASERMNRRFACVIDSPVIEDDRQTALAQFLRFPGADHWLELVPPNGRESVLRRALERSGGGPHHLCFEVDDIDGACERLREDGMWIVSPPVAGSAFGGRRIAWLMDHDNLLVELVESGAGPLVRQAPAGE